MNQSAEKERDRRARWLEVGISVAASVLTSAIVVSWTLSAVLATMKTTQEEHDRRLMSQQAQITVLADRSVLAAERAARIDAQYGDILRRLESIDRKLERTK